MKTLADEMRAISKTYLPGGPNDIKGALSRGAEMADSVLDLTALLDSLNAPTHDHGPDDRYRAPPLSLAGRVAALVARVGNPVFGVLKEVEAMRRAANHTDGFARDARFALASAAYSLSGAEAEPENRRILFSFPPGMRESTTPRKDLVKAAALIVAEIERIDRAAALSTLAAQDGELLS